MSETHSAVLHCPYCAEEDLRPHEDSHGAWLCAVVPAGLRCPVDRNLAGRPVQLSLRFRLLYPILVQRVRRTCLLDPPLPQGACRDLLRHRRHRPGVARRARRARAGVRAGRGDRALGGGDVRPPARRRRLDAGHHDVAPGGLGPARRRRALPGHRLPLPRDAPGARPGLPTAASHRRERDTAPDRSPSRTPSSGRDCTSATPTCAASCARSTRSRRRSTGYDAWVSGLRRVEAPSRANAPVVGWDATHGKVKVNPIARLDRRGRRQLPAQARPAAAPADRPGLPVDRLRAVHPAGRAGRRPALRPLAGPGKDRMRHPQLTPRELSVPAAIRGRR